MRLTKEDLKKDDLLLDIGNIVEFFKNMWQKHRDRIIIGLLIGGVAVLFLVIFVFTSIRSNNEASRKFNGALLTYANTNMSPSDRYASAKKAFEAVLQEHPRTTIAADLRQYLANCYFFLGEYDKAIETYRQNAAGLGSGSRAIYAMEGIGKSYEGKGDIQTALQTYQDAVKKYPRHFLVALLHMDIGGCYEKTGKQNEAAAEYQKTIDMDSGSLFAKDARTRLSLMGQ